MHYWPDTMLCGLARRFLRKQAEVLTARLGGAKTRRDVEDVHQVRVACRRMRAGLEFFGDCFDDDKADRWRRQLKKMLKRFGPARDCDVQIAFLQNILSDTMAWDKKWPPGVARLLLRLNQRRDALQAGLVKAIRRLSRDQLLINLQFEMERLADQIEHADEREGRTGFYERAAERIAERLAEVYEKRPSLNDPDDQPGHHALRIAVKKLRYTLELCDLALNGQLKKGVKRLKKLQTLLGDLHDCDVWVEQIEAFITEETEYTKAYYGHSRTMRKLLPGLHYLQFERQTKRHDLFGEISAYMAELEADGFWDWIAESVKEEAVLPDQTDDSDDEGDFDGGQ